MIRTLGLKLEGLFILISTIPVITIIIIRIIFFKIFSLFIKRIINKKKIKIIKTVLIIIASSIWPNNGQI